MDIFRRIAVERKWEISEDTPAEVVAEKEEERRIWNEVMKQLHEPFDVLCEALDQGLEHAALQLEFIPRPKEKKVGMTDQDPNATDVEAEAQLLKPGDAGFCKVIEKKVQYFYSRKGAILHCWARERGLMMKDGEEEWPDCDSLFDKKRERGQAQLYILLYMEQLVSLIPGFLVLMADQLLLFCARRAASNAVCRCTLQVRPCESSFRSQTGRSPMVP